MTGFDEAKAKIKGNYKERSILSSFTHIHNSLCRNSNYTCISKAAYLLKFLRVKIYSFLICEASRQH